MSSEGLGDVAAGGLDASVPGSDARPGEGAPDTAGTLDTALVSDPREDATGAPETAVDTIEVPDVDASDAGLDEVFETAVDGGLEDTTETLVDTGPSADSDGSSPQDGSGGRACIVDSDCLGLEVSDKCLGPWRCIDYSCQQDVAAAVICPSDDPCIEAECEPDTGVCAETPVCSCETSLTLICGGQTSWSSNDPGLHPTFETMGCGPQVSPEPVRLLTFEGRGRVRIEGNDNVSSLHVLHAPASPETMNCEPDSCVAGAVLPERNDAIYLDAGANSRFTLAVVETGANRLVSLAATCNILREKWCDDGVDDELDGAVDCADTDCADTPDCLETCIDPGLVTWCWEQDSDFLPPGLGRASHYACDPLPQPGREHVFRFRPYYTETVRFGFWGADGMSLKLLVDEGGGCRPSECIASSTGDLWFDVVANTTYYLVVDATHTFGGSFMVDFDCNPGVTR